jgi:hypothetical protein
MGSSQGRLMKRILNSLMLLTLGFMAIGCNEKISPELQNANINNPGGTGGSSGGSSGGQYFRLVNQSPTMLNYKLHKTGPGNGAAKCQVTSTAPLSSSEYASSVNQEYDISCFLEAEELSLHYNGMSFAIEASPNTCEYIGYTPFSFFDNIPGDSSGSYTHAKCADDVGDGDIAGLANGALCSEYIQTDLPMGLVPSAFMVEKEADLCRFNYKTDMCDIGEINVTEISFSWSSDDPPQLISKTAKKKIDCAGKVANCVKGPIRKMGEAANFSKYTQIMSSKDKTPFSETITYEKLFPVRSSNREYANFRRNLASVDIDFINSFDLADPATANSWYATAYRQSFAGQTEFHPDLMDLYSMNLRMDLDFPHTITPIIDDSTYEAIAYGNGYAARPIAAEPFMSYSSEYPISPFYTFYCLDRAMDIKARIRLAVRDWDRIYDNSIEQFELISDIDLGPNARQDVPWEAEKRNSLTIFNYYNDRHDWDDFIPMERSPAFAPFDPANTLWMPSTGFFNSANFTKGKY